MWQGKDNQLDIRHNDVKTAESGSPSFGESAEKGSHTQTQTCEDWPHEETHVRTKIENVKENSSSVSALFLLTFFSSLLSLTWSIQFSFSVYLFLRTTKMCSSK